MENRSLDVSKLGIGTTLLLTTVTVYQWKYEFCRTIFSAVLESTLTAKPPNYETVLELDKKVRQMTLPPHLNVFMSASDMDFTPSVYMRGCMLAQYRIISALLTLYICE